MLHRHKVTSFCLISVMPSTFSEIQLNKFKVYFLCMSACYGQQIFFLHVLCGEGDYLYFIPTQTPLVSLFSLYLIAAVLSFNLLGRIYIEVYEGALVLA